MKLEALTKENCEQVRQWRNDSMVSLRTPFLLTEEMQEDFYRDVVCNRNSLHRYWAIWLEPHEEEPCFIGMGGITNIQWENRLGEISLIIDSQMRNKGYGEQAVDLLLDQAFNFLNLKTVCGECYGCNESGCSFWQSIAAKYNGFTTALPNRKFWAGEYHNSLYFSIDRDDFNKR